MLACAAFGGDALRVQDSRRMADGRHPVHHPGARLNRPRRLARASPTLTQRNQRRHHGDSGSPIISADDRSAAAAAMRRHSSSALAPSLSDVSSSRQMRMFMQMGAMHKHTVGPAGRRAVTATADKATTRRGHDNRAPTADRCGNSIASVASCRIPERLFGDRRLGRHVATGTVPRGPHARFPLECLRQVDPCPPGPLPGGQPPG